MNKNKHKMELVGDYIVVSEELDRSEARLAVYGFYLSEVVQEVDALLDNRLSLDYIFTNPSTQLRMRIGFLSASVGHLGGFLVELTNFDNQTMMVDDWLKNNDHDEQLSHFSYRLPCDDFGLFVKTFFTILFHLFDNELKSTVDGTHFIETPFDWGDFK